MVPFTWWSRTGKNKVREVRMAVPLGGLSRRGYEAVRELITLSIFIWVMISWV